MKKQHSTKRALLLSALSLLMCVSMLIGSTFAWFTDSVSSAENKIQAGNLDIQLLMYNGTTYVDISNSPDPIFGTADRALDSTNTLWEPGKTQVAYLAIKNNGSLSLKYKVTLDVYDSVKNLHEVMEYAIVPDAQPTANQVTSWTDGDNVVLGEQVVSGDKDVPMDPGSVHYFALAIHMPEEADNRYQNGEVSFDLTVFATQLDAESDSFGKDYDEDAPKLTDTWDGTADTSWYNDTDNEFTLTSTEQLAGLAELVDGGNKFAGKTIKLDVNMDLKYIPEGSTEPMCFEPIGSYRKDLEFKGTFDGQGHTISNMSQNTWALDNGYYYNDCGMGLFGAVVDATIKNLIVDGANISGEYGLCGTVAAVARGECTFENIAVKNSNINDYQYYAGGIVGWAEGEQTYKNINMDTSTIVGSQWGEFGNCNGGIIGGASTDGTYHFEDCTVACRIDATNDVVSAYQWYNYRNSGMLIGQVGPETIQNECTTVTADNVTCKNVTVIYGDWANYTYCEFAGTGYPYVRVQAGVSVDSYTNVRYGHPTDANGNTVVDDNHVHNDGEAHHKLIAFDYLFGGPANHRYCYYGISAHPGVTVIYNNK